MKWNDKQQREYSRSSIIPIYFMSHYIVEILSSNKTIVIQISFCKHFLKLLICHILSQIFCHSFQFQNCDLSSFMCIKRSKDLVYFSPTIFLAQFSCGQSKKFRKIYSSRLIIIQLCQYLINKFILSTKAKIEKCLLKLLWIYHTATITIENIECQLDIFDLLQWNGQSYKVLWIETFLLRSLGLLFRGNRSCFNWRWRSFFTHLNKSVNYSTQEHIYHQINSKKNLNYHKYKTKYYQKSYQFKSRQGNTRFVSKIIEII